MNPFTDIPQILIWNSFKPRNSKLSGLTFKENLVSRQSWVLKLVLNNVDNLLNTSWKGPALPVEFLKNRYYIDHLLSFFQILFCGEPLQIERHWSLRVWGSLPVVRVCRELLWHRPRSWPRRLSSNRTREGPKSFC